MIVLVDFYYLFQPAIVFLCFFLIIIIIIIIDYREVQYKENNALSMQLNR